MNLDAWLSRAEAARRANVQIAVIDMWLARGWLDEHGERQHLATKRVGRTRFIRHGCVLRACRDTDNNPRSHRRLSFGGNPLAAERRAGLRLELQRLGAA